MFLQLWFDFVKLNLILFGNILLKRLLFMQLLNCRSLSVCLWAGVVLFCFGCNSQDSNIADGDADLDETENIVADSDDEDHAEMDCQEVEIENTVKCNGFEELCLKRYSEVAYATTHNSMSNKEDGWVAYNQKYPMKKQLEDGIRALMLDTYYFSETTDGDSDTESENQTYLCHGDCFFGKKILKDGLKDIADFLSENPNEVVTIVFESYISAESTKDAFVESGLIQYVYTYDDNIGWPTIGEMVALNKRVVVFTDTDGGTFDWYMDIWDYCFDTEWHNVEKEDFNCEKKRGSLDNDLFILNHFLYGGFDLPSEEKAEIANSNPFFQERVSQCQNERGQIPNFITVDFYSIGDIFDVVNYINGVQQQ